VARRKKNKQTNEEKKRKESKKINQIGKNKQLESTNLYGLAHLCISC